MRLRAALTAWLPAALLALSQAALAQPLQCEVDGAAVNPANGNTTRDKTGIMRCRDAEGRMQREEELRNGVFVGLRRFHRAEGVEEFTVNERGNRDGTFRSYFPDGRLREESNYSDGSLSGPARRLHPGGQTERIAFHGPGNERAALEYTEDGRLRSLQCARRSLLPEDRIPCGFGGSPSAVDLYGGRRGETRLVARVAYAEGRLVSREDLDASGQPTRTYLLRDGIETTREHFPDGKPRRERAFTAAREAPRSGTEREWAQNGQMLIERRFVDGAEASATAWFMNGNVRERRTTEGRGRDALVRTESYHDSGRLRARTVTKGSLRVGKQESYDESGRLRDEAVHDERGVLVSRRTYDEQGVLKSDEEFFEDGSRKLVR